MYKNSWENISILCADKPFRVNRENGGHDYHAVLVTATRRGSLKVSYSPGVFTSKAPLQGSTIVRPDPETAERFRPTKFLESSALQTYLALLNSAKAQEETLKLELARDRVSQADTQHHNNVQRQQQRKAS